MGRMRKGTPVTPEFLASIQEPYLQISRNRGDNSNESNYTSQETQSNMHIPANTTDTNNNPQPKPVSAPDAVPTNQIPVELQAILGSVQMAVSAFADAQNRSNRLHPAPVLLPKEMTDVFAKVGAAADAFADAQKPKPLTQDLLRTAASLTVRGVILCGLVVGTTAALRAISPVEAAVV